MTAALHKMWAALACLSILVVFGIGSPSARADVIYTYTGNTFNDLRNGATCPPVCNVAGSFHVSQPLAPNLPLTLITPLSFALTSGLTTLTDGEPTDTALEVGTDASGNINTWSWVVVGPAAAPTARILTENIPGITADDVRFGNDPPPFVGPVAGLLQNDPGVWTSSVPEPGSLGLLGAGLLALMSAVRWKVR